MYKKLFVYLFIVIGLFSATPLLMVSAQDVGTGGVGGRPAFPREDNPRTESIFIHTLDTNESVDDGVNIINNSEETKTINVYATDSVVSSGGAFACRQDVEAREDVGEWVTLERNQVILQPAESEIVNFTIQVPAQTDVGEHNGCIVIQEQTAPEQGPSQGIGLSFRSAIRVAVLVPGEITKSLTIESFVLSESDTALIAKPTLNNNGNVSVDAQLDSTLRYWFGFKASESGGQFPVLRGEAAEFNLEHPQPFWGGFVKANLDVSYNDNPDQFVGEESDDLAELSDTSQWLFVMPQPLALVIYIGMLLLLGAGGIGLKRQLNHRRDVRENWLSYTVKSGENIHQIAKKHDVSWKKLAKTNGLKPPYNLEKGDKISVPRNND